MVECPRGRHCHPWRRLHPHRRQRAPWLCAHHLCGRPRLCTDGGRQRGPATRGAPAGQPRSP
eukprot:4118488-Heterocapsa_arctica.AAC.1